MKTEIYLIRHAEPYKGKVIYGNVSEEEQLVNEKLVLSSLGEKQAELLSTHDELKGIDIVYSSNYVRAISTAKYMAEKNNCEIIIDENFNERKLGTEQKDKEFWLEQMKNENAKTIDGESQKEVRERFISSIDNILKNNNYKKIAIVTHAAAMTFALMNWCNLDNVLLEGKKRKLSFNGKIIIDGSFNTPEVFKLIFENNELIDIMRIDM